MRSVLLSLAAAALFTMVDARLSLAQRHQVPALSSCIREFYDAGMYNYLDVQKQLLTLRHTGFRGEGRLRHDRHYGPASRGQ